MKVYSIKKFVFHFLFLIIGFSGFQSVAQPCVGSVSSTVNPQPTGGGYAPGTVVTYCYTVNNYSMSGSNWFEGFSIQLGPGWLPGSITPVTYPTNFQGGGGQWIWVSNTFVNNGVTFGPGFFFDLDMNGISQNDFGDSGAGPWTMCFSVTVGNVPGSSLGVGVAPVSDGYAGSWTNGGCNGLIFTPVTPSTIIVLGCGNLIPSVANQINVVCNGDSNGSFTIGTSNGAPPFTFSFQGGPFNATNNFTNLAAGTYTVVIQDANNCTIPFPVTITQPTNPLSVTLIFKNNPGCANGATGNYRIIGTGGTGPYTYSTDGVNFVPPNNGASFQTNGLAAGTYTVFVKDTNGCTASIDITITPPLPLTGTITAQTNAPCGATGNGSVTIAGAGGTPVYTYSIDGGAFQLSGTFNNLTPGNHTVTIKDANNCSTTVLVDILQPTNPNGAVDAQTNVDCFGNATGSLTLSGANGTAPYTFSLNAGAFSSGPFNNLAAGVYNITVQDVNGCTGTFNATITEPASLVLNIANQINVNCFGASTGSVTLSGSNGTAPFSYSDGVNNNTNGIFNGLAAGNYAYTMTDNNGCTTTINATITQPATGVGAIIVVQNNVLCSGTSTGSFTLQGNNGAPPYSYTLNGTTNTTGTFTNLGANIYNVTVSDANGCTFIQTVNLNSPNALTALIANQTAVSCFGGNNASVTVTASNGTNPYTFTLGATNNATGVFNSLAAGAYNVIVSDANGCTFDQPVTITQPAAALSTSINNQTNVSCFGGNNGSVTILASNGTGPFSYQLGATTNNSGIFNNLNSGNYSVTATDNNGCITNQAVTITQPAAALGATTTSVTPVDCFGSNTGQFQISGTGGTAPYSYTMGALNNTTGQFTNLTAGIYTVNVTDINSCAFAYQVTVTEPAAPLALNIDNQTNVICFGGTTGSLQLSAAGGTPNYLFGLSGTTLSNNPQITGLAAGTFTVLVKDNNGCTTTINATITQPAQGISGTVNNTTDILCFGGSTGQISLTAANGTPPYSYTLGPNTNTTGTFTNLSAGAYTVNITDNNGCVGQSSVTLTQPATILSVTVPTITNPLCNGSSNGVAAALATGGTSNGNYTYSWNTNPPQNTNQANNLPAGTYTITVTDNNNCVATAVVTLTEPNFQLNSTASAALCKGETVTLTASSLDGAAPVIYTWTNQNDGSTIQGNAISVSPNTTTNYTVIATDANGCVTTANIVPITVNPAPVALFTEDIKEGCQPLCVTFTALATLPGTNWNWDFGDGQTDVGQNAVHCFKESGLYSVSLTAVSDMGCKNTIQKNDLITVYQIPKVIFSVEPKETTISNPTVYVSNQTVGAEEYLWTFDKKNTSSLFEPTFSYTEPGEYCILLLATNDYGCIDSSRECVTIKPDYTIYVPNAFTPNGDGLNDVFLPLAQSVREYELIIYNRWGLKVFTSNELNLGWNGATEAQGAYNYVILLTTNGGEEKIYSGSVTLYR